MIQVNNIAVLVAAVAGMVVGCVWFALFGKVWMKLSGITQKEAAKAKKKGMAAGYVGQFLVLLVMAYVLSMFINYLGAKTPAEAIGVGAWLWLGFVATTTAEKVIWEGKSVKLYLFNNVHNLLGIAVMAAVLAVM